jgi:hypothetical protein
VTQDDLLDMLAGLVMTDLAECRTLMLIAIRREESDAAHSRFRAPQPA